MEENFDYSLNREELEFILESNAIENIFEISYNTNSKSKKGHDYAWKLFRHKARNKQILTLDDFCHAQRLLMEEQSQIGIEIPEEMWGRIRSLENPVNVSCGSYKAPDYLSVPKLMQDFMEYFEYTIKNKKDPLVFSALAHRRFEMIHPFKDGNGRVGRLISNYIKEYHNLPILIFNFSKKREYIDSLESNKKTIEFFRKISPP